MRGPSRLHRTLLLWLGSFVLLGALGSLWSLSAPLSSGPDEGSHVIKAAAIARGEWTGRPVVGRGAAFVDFSVPATYGRLGRYSLCFRRSPDVPASCSGILKASAAIVTTPSYVGRYPPLYYLLVGWPSLLDVSSGSIYGMRLVSVALSSAFLALAVTLSLLYGESMALLGAVFLSMTPVVVYLSSVVEPNGLEVSAAICLWTALLLLGRQAGDEPPRALVHAGGASAVVLALMRGISVAWLVAIVFVVFAVVIPSVRVRQIWSCRAARRWTVAVVAACGAALAWVFADDALAVVPVGGRQDPVMTVITTVLGQTPRWLEDMIGVFSPWRTNAPLGVDICLWVALGALVTWATLRADRRDRAAMALLVAATVLVPPLLTALSSHTDGIIWQGRYILPLAVGLPLVAGMAVSRQPAGGSPRRPRSGEIVPATGVIDPGRTEMTRRARAEGLLLALAALGCQVGALYGFLRRFAVGTRGPIDILFGHVSWEPPIPCLAIVLGALVLAGLASVWVFVVAPRIAGRCARAG